MMIDQEFTLEIRITKEGGLFGCDICHDDGELLIGFIPEYETAEAALTKTLFEFQRNHYRGLIFSDGIQTRQAQISDSVTS